jgi:hypothetical protein
MTHMTTFDLTTPDAPATTIPAEAASRDNPNKLPFGTLYANLLADTVKGATMSPRLIGTKFIPQAYWEERFKERGETVPDEAKFPSYQKEKLRNAFREWQKQGKEKGGEGSAAIAMATYQAMYRKAHGEQKAGVTIWIDAAPEYIKALKAAAEEVAKTEAAKLAAEEAAKAEAAKPAGKKAA